MEVVRPLPPPVLAVRRPYRPPGRLVPVLQCCLAACVVAAAVRVGASIADLRLIALLGDAPTSVTVAQVEGRDQRAVILAFVVLAVLGVTGVVFIAWTRCLYRNLASLSVFGLRFTEGWAVGAWFVPILNLIRPKQIVDDIWRAGAPPAPPTWRWQYNAVPTLIHLWWASWITAMLLSLGVDNEPVELDEARGAALAELAAGVSLAIAAVLALNVVRALTRRQAQFALSRLGGGEPSATAPVYSLRMSMLLAALGIGVAVAAFLAFDDAGRTSGSSRATRDAEGTIVSAGGLLTIELEIGDCLDYPDALDPRAATDDLLSVDAMPCDVSHQAEVIARVVHPGGSDDPFPGLDALFDYGTDKCLARFEPLVGIPFAESALDMRVIGPLSEGWDVGDREILCVAERVDGRRLAESVIGSRL